MQFNFIITNATNASPISVTVSEPHHLMTGDEVVITGVLGNTAANGTFIITVTGNTTFTLNSSIGNGIYTSGGIVTVSEGAGDHLITNIVNDNGIIKITSAAHGLTSLDIVIISGVLGYTNANGTWQVRVESGNTNDFWLIHSQDHVPQTYTGNGTFVVINNQGKTITDVSNTSPIIVTSPSHNLGNIDSELFGVEISGVTGNVAANGKSAFIVIDNNTFSLPGSEGSDDYASAPTISVPPRTMAVECASNATPIVIKSTAHGLITGNTVVITEVLGTISANGTFTITVVDANQFSLNTSIGDGAYIGGGIITTVPVPIVIENVTFTSPVVITVPSHGLTACDKVIIKDVKGIDIINGEFYVTPIDANTLALNGPTENNYDLPGFDDSTPTFTIVPIINQNSNLAIAEDSTFTGTGKIILGTPVADFNEFAVLEDRAIVEYKLSKIDGSFEYGIGTYDKIRDVIDRLIINQNSANTESPLDVTAGAKTIEGGYSFVGTTQSGASDLTATFRLAEIQLAEDALMDAMTRTGPTGAAAVDSNIGALDRVFFRVQNPALRIRAGDPVISGQLYMFDMYQRLLRGGGGGHYIFAYKPPAAGASQLSVSWVKISLAGRTQAQIAQLLSADVVFLQRAGYTVVVHGGATQVGGLAIQPTLIWGANPFVIGPAAARTVVQGAPITRFARLGGWLGRRIPFITVATTIIEAGWHVIKIFEDSPILIAPIQGRLQLNERMAQTDYYRRSIGNIVSFVPIYQDEPGKASICLYGSSYDPIGYFPWSLQKSGPLTFTTANGLHFANYQFVAEDGSLPFVDISQPSPIPFTVFPGKLPDQSKARAGIPIDIFIAAGHRMPRTFDGPLYPTTRTSSNGLRNVKTMPTLFYLNWRDSTNRKIADVGHSMTYRTFEGVGLADTVQRLPGWYLNAIELADPDTVSATPLPADTIRAQPRDWSYLYLGTLIPIADGVGVCLPGYRLLFNYFNRLSYNDWNTAPENFISLPSLAESGYRSSINPCYDIWTHYFVNPRDADHNIIFPIPHSGRFSITVIGPQRVYVESYSLTSTFTPLNRQVMYKGSTVLNNPAQEDGSLVGEPVNIEWTNVRLTENIPSCIGVIRATVECVPGIGFDTRRAKNVNWGFVGSMYSFVYTLNTGFQRVHRLRGVDPATVPGELLAPSDVSNKDEEFGSPRGFGFRGAD